MTSIVISKRAISLRLCEVYSLLNECHHSHLTEAHYELSLAQCSLFLF